LPVPVILPSFVDFVLLFWAHYETTTKAKIFYAKENGSLRKSRRWAA